jgi:hypothetical protein
MLAYFGRSAVEGRYTPEGYIAIFVPAACFLALGPLSFAT